VIFVDLSLRRSPPLASLSPNLAGYDIHTSHQAYLFSLGFTFIGAAIFAFSRARTERRASRRRPIIGIVYAVSAAVAILLMSKSHAGDGTPQGDAGRQHPRRVLV